MQYIVVGHSENCMLLSKGSQTQTQSPKSQEIFWSSKGWEEGLVHLCWGSFMAKVPARSFAKINIFTKSQEQLTIPPAHNYNFPIRKLPRKPTLAQLECVSQQSWNILISAYFLLCSAIIHHSPTESIQQDKNGKVIHRSQMCCSESNSPFNSGWNIAQFWGRDAKENSGNSKIIPLNTAVSKTAESGSPWVLSTWSQCTSLSRHLPGDTHKGPLHALTGKF